MTPTIFIISEYLIAANRERVEQNGSQIIAQNICVIGLAPLSHDEDSTLPEVDTRGGLAFRQGSALG